MSRGVCSRAARRGYARAMKAVPDATNELAALARATAVGAAFLAAAICVGGCSGVDAATGVDALAGTKASHGTGGVGLEVAIAPGVQFQSLGWTISGAGLPTYTGNTTVGDAQSIAFVIPEIEAGGPYTISLSGVDTAGDPCNGKATFSVSAGSTSRAMVAITCTAPSRTFSQTDITTGSLAVDASVTYVTGAPYDCPGISGLSISPAAILAPQTAALTVDTVQASGGSAGTLTILWTATQGAFVDTGASSSSLAGPSFSCGAFVGTAVVTVTLSYFGSNNGVDAGNVCADALYQTISGNVVCDPS